MKCAVRKKKVLYRRLPDTGMEESKQLYKEVKLEAKKVVRKLRMRSGYSWVKNWRRMLGGIKGDFGLR